MLSADYRNGAGRRWQFELNPDDNPALLSADVAASPMLDVGGIQDIVLAMEYISRPG